MSQPYSTPSNKPRYRWLMLLVGFVLLLIPTVLLSLLLMPLIRSWQELDSVPVSYAIHSWRWVFYVLGGLLFAVGLWQVMRSGKWAARITASLLLLIVVGVFYMVNAKVSADVMFQEPRVMSFKPAQELVDNQTGHSQLMVVSINGETKGYFVNTLGYHHKVFDTVGGTPVMVTYCTMCHSGRVFSPIIDGKHEKFRLVGANHFNAMVEDETSGTWWYQATGEAIAGPKKGKFLTEIPYRQVSLASFATQYPTAMVLIDDPYFVGHPMFMKTYDKGRGDTSSGLHPRSIIYGMVVQGHAIAYTRHTLDREQCLRDTLRGHAFVVVKNPDGVVAFEELAGEIDSSRTITVHEEYWLSWKHFHPSTEVH